MKTHFFFIGGCNSLSVKRYSFIVSTMSYLGGHCATMNAKRVKIAANRFYLHALCSFMGVVCSFITEKVKKVNDISFTLNLHHFFMLG